VRDAHHGEYGDDPDQRAGERVDVVEAARQPRRDEDGEQGEQQSPGGEGVAELVDPELQRERRVGQQREEAEVVEDGGQAGAARGARRRRRTGRAS
jgi:hypothetical protein